MIAASFKFVHIRYVLLRLADDRVEKKEAVSSCIATHPYIFLYVNLTAHSYYIQCDAAHV